MNDDEEWAYCKYCNREVASDGKSLLPHVIHTFGGDRNPCKGSGSPLTGEGPKKWKHGVSGYVNYKCRCLVCKKANADRQREMRKRRAQKLKDGLVTPPHGTATTYCNYECRCEACKGAWSIKLAQRRERKRDAD